MQWIGLPAQSKRLIFGQVASILGIRPEAVEKDAWVTLILRLLFSSSLAPHLVFKGGTSLSKVYGIIERFSEDIDLNISRDFLGFEGDLTKGQIRKLRRASHRFVAEDLENILRRQMEEFSISANALTFLVENTRISDQDPEKMLVEYPSVYYRHSYLRPKIVIEIGARALSEPYEERNIQSLIGSHFSGKKGINDEPFAVNVVIPEKTFLEKLILMHEEFTKPAEKIRYQRMSRHLYDIYKLWHTPYGPAALQDKNLFNNIIRHRSIFSPVKTTDYDALRINGLNFLPPPSFLKKYRNDYQEMKKSMIYGDAPGFDALIRALEKIAL